MNRRRVLFGVLIAFGLALQALAALGVVRAGTLTYAGAAVTLLLVVGIIVDLVRLDRLELLITLRYLRSRRASRLLSLITVIAVGGVTVGVMALVVVLGVMNGLQADLRDKILVANPHVRVLTYGEGLRLDDWRKVLGEVRGTPGVEAAAPFVLTQGLISAGHDYAEGVIVYGVEPDTGHHAVTSFARHFTRGDLTFKTTHADVEGGVALGTRLASKLTAFPGSVVTLVARSEEHTSELQSQSNLVCRLLLEKKKRRSTQ